MININQTGTGSGPIVSGHTSYAIDFAHSIIDQFDLLEQNQILEIIRQKLIDRRGVKIEQLEKELTYFRESLFTL